MPRAVRKGMNLNIIRVTAHKGKKRKYAGGLVVKQCISYTVTFSCGCERYRRDSYGDGTDSYLARVEWPHHFSSTPCEHAI